MPKTQGKPNRIEMRKRIEELILAAPDVSDRAIARSLNCSPTTVGTIRAKLIVGDQIGQSETQENDFASHPYFLKNPDILTKNLNVRGIRALRHKGVVEMMSAHNYTSAVYAERKMRLMNKATLKSPLSGLTADDYVLHVANIHDGLPMIEDRSITHIACDVPYQRDLLIPLLDSLGEVAERVLTDEGVVLVMVGGSWLPDAMRVLGKHLKHWWQIAYLSDRASTYFDKRLVHTRTKWVLMYVRKDAVYSGLQFSDLIKTPPAEEDEKDWHAEGWSQSVGGFKHSWISLSFHLNILF